VKVVCRVGLCAKLGHGALLGNASLTHIDADFLYLMTDAHLFHALQDDVTSNMAT
jgi:hypothetical protein